MTTEQTTLAVINPMHPRVKELINNVVRDGVRDEDFYGLGCSLGQYGWALTLLESGGTYGDEMVASDGYPERPEKVVVSVDKRTITLIWL